MDTGEDQRISKEEFTDDSVKKTIETVSFFLPRDQPEQLYPIFSGLDRLRICQLNLTGLTGVLKMKIKNNARTPSPVTLY